MSKAHWLALASVSGIGGATTKKLLEQFGDIEAVFDATDAQLLEIPRLTESVVEQLRAVALEKVQEDIYALAQEDIEVWTWDDARFPARLRALKDAPVILFARGALRQADVNAVAIVGTREPMEASTRLAATLARELALRGLTVVSGLALGIDTAAHRGALDAEEGRTVAVLGSGIRAVHPRENAELAERIASRGAVLAEVMPNTPPRGPQLMARDRIISGLSRAVIVVEAGTQSGSLDTAERGRKQGRLVYAVPGSAGTEGLLKGGARRLDADAFDFDALAKEIYAHEIRTEQSAAPKQGTLF